MVTHKFQIGDRVILARHSKRRGDFGITSSDYGKCGYVNTVKWMDDAPYYSMRLDRGRLWNVTEDQLDREEGPW